MVAHLTSVLAFMVVSFAAQGLSHFVINKDHFASIGFMRPDPVLPLGIFGMLIQGVMLSAALRAWKGDAATVVDGLWIGLIFGAFLVSYIAIVEPSKYQVPSIAGWFRVEALVGLVQFAVFGALLGWIHQQF